MRAASRAKIKIAVLLAVLALLAALWRFTSLGDYITLRNLIGLLRPFRESSLAPFIVTAGFLVGGFLMVPVTLLIFVTLLVFGESVGFAYSFIGLMVSAIVIYWTGRVLGSDIVCRFAGARVRGLAGELTDSALLPLIILHIVPALPFFVVNVAKGIARVRFVDHVISTVVGSLPGLLVMALFRRSFIRAVTHPSPTTIAVVAAITLCVIAGLFVLRRRFIARERN